MAELEVQLVGPIRRPQGKRRLGLTVREGCTVEEVLREVGFRDREIHAILVAVNGARVRNDHSLSDGDRVELMMRLGGG